MDDGGKLDRFELHGLLVAERQQPARQGRCPLARLGDAPDGFRGCLCPQRFAAQQIRVALYHRQQVVELVRNAGGQAPDRLQLLRLPQLPFQLQAVRHILDDHQPAWAGFQRDRLRPNHRFKARPVAAPQRAGPVADAVAGLTRFGSLRQLALPKLQLVICVLQERVGGIARETQKAGVGVQETAVRIALNRHRHGAGEKRL